MELLNLLFGIPSSSQPQIREGGYHPSNKPPTWLIGDGNNTKSGVSITQENVIGIPAVYAVTGAISESLAMLPLVVYERNKRETQKAVKHPLYKLLQIAPNTFQDKITFLAYLIDSALLAGNGYSQVVRDNVGRPAELIPLNPSYVEPIVKNEKSGIKIFYDYSPPNGNKSVFSGIEILHIRNKHTDGIKGKSPITLCRESFGLAKAAELHGAYTFANGASLSGYLKIPEWLEDEASANRLANGWNKKYSGVNKSGGTAVLEGGAEWHQVSMSNEDAQFVDVRKFSIEEMIRIFRCPPHKIGHLEKSTFSNIEHQGIEFVTDTLMPNGARIESAINALFFADTPQYYVKFNYDALLRGDTVTRFQAYKLAVDGGWFNRNEVREKEEMNPAEGLDEYLHPLNMTTGKEDINSDSNLDAKSDKKNNIRSEYELLLTEVYDRLLNKERKFLERLEKKRTENPTEDIDVWTGLELLNISTGLSEAFKGHLRSYLRLQGFNNDDLSIVNHALSNFISYYQDIRMSEIKNNQAIELNSPKRQKNIIAKLFDIVDTEIINLKK